jgi:signal transduction histidine kinase
VTFNRRHKLRSGELQKVEVRAGPVETPSGVVLYCVVHDVTERARAKDKKLLLTADVVPGFPARVWGDLGCLRRILLNLAGNAIKFTHEGRITIYAYTQAEDDQRTTLRFSVTDTGIGIPAQRVVRLFQPFSQVDSSTVQTVQA